MADTGGDAAWQNTFYNTSYLMNSFQRRWFYSYKYWNTGDNMRYVLFDQQIDDNPDAGSWSAWVENSIFGGADTSQGGTNSTIHARFWSMNIRYTQYSNGCIPGGACSQQDYYALDEKYNSSANGNSVTVSLGVGLDFKGGGSTSGGWSQTSALYNSSVTVPSVPDIYSRYYDFTAQDSVLAQQDVYVDLTAAQVMTNGWNGSFVHIGLSSFGHFESFVLGQWAGRFTIGTGNWGDSYYY
jgi:hypothetical protein